MTSPQMAGGPLRGMPAAAVRRAERMTATPLMPGRCGESSAAS
jgi:hypothetical protein